MKKSMKRILCALLTLCLLGGLAGVAGLADAETGSRSTCGNGFVWQFEEKTGVLTIQGSGPMYDFEDEMSLPWSQYLTQIKKVVVIHGVTSIGKNAFSGCAALEEISLPETVTAIGIGAFKDCERLQEVDLSMTAVTALKADTFAGCDALTTVKLPATIQSVDAAAFRGAQNLREVVCIGEEAQIDEILKDVDLGDTEIIVVPTEDPGDETAKEEAPAPTQPQPTEPAPTTPVPTQPAEPVEEVKVRYEVGSRITETFLDGVLVGRIDEIWSFYQNGYAEKIEYEFENGLPVRKNVYEINHDFWKPQLDKTKTITIEYDEKGAIQAERCTDLAGNEIYSSHFEDGLKFWDEANGEKLVSYEYDENGRLVRELQERETIQYYYDESGELVKKMTESERTWGDGSNKQEQTYENGKLVCQEEFNGNNHRKMECTWNEAGQLLSYHFTQTDSYFNEDYGFLYKYDENGKLIEESFRNNEMGFSSTTKYAEDGTMSSEQYYDDGTPRQISKEKIEEVNGEKVIIGKMDWNKELGGSQGIVTTTSGTSEDGNSQCVMRFDANGQLKQLYYTVSQDGRYYYQYAYSVDEQTGELIVSSYRGTGQFDENDGGVMGQEPNLENDPLVMAAMRGVTYAEILAMIEENAPETTESVPEATNHEIAEPEATEPEATEPEATEPEATEPEITEPEATEPEATEPEITEPEVTEPEFTAETGLTEPEAIVPAVAEPVEAAAA